MKIDVLPDDVLVEVFFYVNIKDWFEQNPWHVLVHVCRRWRYLVFASPRRLSLRLEYEGHGPISEVLDSWPVLPITLISGVPSGLPRPKSDQRWDNRVAAFESEHCNRICEIQIFGMSNSRWERFAAAMQKPFPELTNLQIWLDYRDDEPVPVLPDSFLGGSAPRLRELSLRRVSFLSMQKLLLSANGLVKLSLFDIPNPGYISPDAMATALTVTTRLETLHLQFRSPRSLSHPASRPRHPLRRFVLPALTDLMFRGVYEHLEDLLARVDAPLLDCLRIIFVEDINFDVPELYRLVGHTEYFKAFDRAEVFLSHSILLDLYPKAKAVNHRRRLSIVIHCTGLDLQLSSLARVCSPSFPLISTFEELEITASGDLSSSHWKRNTDTRWVEFLDPFIALKNLYLTNQIVRRVCGVLQQELSGERVTLLLPSLRNLFVDESRSSDCVLETMRPFVVARQLSGHPVVIDHWQRQR